MSSITLPSNITTNVLVSPTNLENSVANRLLQVPVNPSALNLWDKSFILVTSFIFCNKIQQNLEVNAKIVNGVTSAKLLHNILVPPGTAFEVIDGNKFILKEGDELFVWHNSNTSGVLDVVLSYTLHNPLTPYEV